MDEEHEIKKILDNNGISITDLKSGKKSAYTYALKICKNINEGNNIEHSYRVFINSYKILKKIKNEIDKNDLLILFYSSLLHDFSKTTEEDTKKQIKAYINESCSFYALDGIDHGISSAFYIKALFEKEKIEFYDLCAEDVNLIILIISFHSISWFHSSFIDSEAISKRALLLSLVFWVADISDGTRLRVAAASLTDEEYQASKTKARSQIEKVDIKPDKIIWTVSNINEHVYKAVNYDNDNLAKHSLILKCLGLPSRIELKTDEAGQSEKSKEEISFAQLASLNLCYDASILNKPLIISSDNLGSLYEKIVSTFSKISVMNDNLTFNNYYCPTILEVQDVGKDIEKNVIIRSRCNRTIEEIKDYTKSWLSPEEEDANKFCFGYTHGQRLYQYAYPCDLEDLEQQKDYKDWSGQINQFESILNLLSKEGRDTREAYAIIAHPIIDNPLSELREEKNKRPSMLVIHFFIEKDNSLSALAFLRSQELSTFFLVNYFEIKELLEKLNTQLKLETSDLKLGRIIMISSISYFNPNIPLFNIPEIYKKLPQAIKLLCTSLERRGKKRKLLAMLEEFTYNVYYEMNVEWCRIIADSLSNKRKNVSLKNCAQLTYENLVKLKKKQEEEKPPSAAEEIQTSKVKIMGELIAAIKEYEYEQD